MSHGVVGRQPVLRTAIEKTTDQMSGILVVTNAPLVATKGVRMGEEVLDSLPLIQGALAGKERDSQHSLAQDAPQTPQINA